MARADFGEVLALAPEAEALRGARASGRPTSQARIGELSPVGGVVSVRAEFALDLIHELQVQVEQAT